MRTELRVLDLFSGIGGFSLGLERTGGFKTVAFCEINAWCRRVLAKHWPDVPIHEDVRKLKGSDVGPVDALCGGYPCQPFSLAGERRGTEDDRHLWPEMYRLVDELRPAWFIGENVAGHISMGLDAVLSDLDSLGYSARTFDIPAVAVDAKHRRHRVWIVAHAEHVRSEVGHAQSRQQSEKGKANHALPCRPDVADATDSIRRTHRRSVAGSERQSEDKTPSRHVREGGGCPRDDGFAASREDVANAEGNGRRQGHPNIGGGGEGGRSWEGAGFTGYCRWESEPDVGRVAHGVPSRVDRLRGLGNAVVPQIPEIIGRAILQAEALL